MNMPSGARLLFRNIAELKRDLAKFDSKRRPVGETAVRVELFRLRKVLQGDLRQGQVAGRAFAPLRVVSRGINTSRKPLARLAVAVKYNVQKEGDVTHMSVGFDGPKSTKAWRRIGHNVQEGKDIDADIRVFGSNLRRLWRRIGGDYDKGRGRSIAKFFFLRKRTDKLKLPARPIVEPFWQAHEKEAEKNIISNFDRKMKGERI